MKLQITLQEVPASVFLDSTSRKIMFAKHSNNNFIDYQQGLSYAAWSKDSLSVDDKDYPYGVWHNVDEPQLHSYFKAALQDSFSVF